MQQEGLPHLLFDGQNAGIEPLRLHGSLEHALSARRTAHRPDFLQTAQLLDVEADQSHCCSGLPAGHPVVTLNCLQIGIACLAMSPACVPADLPAVLENFALHHRHDRFDVFSLQLALLCQAH